VFTIVYDSLKSNTQEFIKESKEIHGDTYIYSATTYSGCYSKVVITCYKHGNFEQVPYSHKQGRGCPVCSESKGEREIRMFLEKQSIEYISQQTFDDCKNVFALPFDFYLPKYNMCIEYDGEQHYRPMGFARGKKGFERTKRNDQIKNGYCDEQGIQLFRIRFDENIKEILKQNIIKILTEDKQLIVVRSNKELKPTLQHLYDKEGIVAFSYTTLEEEDFEGGTSDYTVEL